MADHADREEPEDDGHEADGDDASALRHAQAPIARRGQAALTLTHRRRIWFLIEIATQDPGRVAAFSAAVVRRSVRRPISGAESSGSGAEASSLSRRDQQLWRRDQQPWRRDQQPWR